MIFSETELPGIFVVKPRIFDDNRGYFMERYNKKLFRDHGIEAEFVQDNLSKSHRGTLRGLHLQNPPYEQGKLVSVITGRVLDVAVDIRKKSSTFGKYFATELSGQDKTMVWIPPGFAHGFLTLEDETIFAYKCTGYYNRDSEAGIIWNDPDINIHWGSMNPVLSEKDRQLPCLNNFVSLF